MHGLGPLGCIPSQRVKSKKGQCLKRVNEWIQEFNSKAQELVETLNGRLPSAQFLFADTYSDVYDLIDHPTAYGTTSILFIQVYKILSHISSWLWYDRRSHLTGFFASLYINTNRLSIVAGFKVSNTSCCNVDTTVGGLCLPNSKLCSNREDYVFWDAFHPSDAANEVLAGKLFSSLFSAAPPPKPH